MRRLLWAAGVALVAIAIAWQVLYERGVQDCLKSPLLVICSGPLDAWVLPVTLTAAALLLVAGAWHLMMNRG